MKKIFPLQKILLNEKNKYVRQIKLDMREDNKKMISRFQNIYSSVAESIKETSRFYFEGIKLLINQIKKAREIRATHKERFLKFKTRSEKLFLKDIRMDALKLIPILLLLVLPGSTLILPVVAYLFPIILPKTLHTPSYKVKH